MKEFTVWLIAEINSRGWLPAELAKRAGLTQGGLSRILNGERKPGPEACVGIARALGLSPECVFRKAGLLPSEPDPAPGEQDVLNTYRGLTGPQRQAALAMLRGLSGQPATITIRPAGTPPELPPEPPTPDLEDIIDLLKQLDGYSLRQVYDYARFQANDQDQRRDSASRRRSQWGE